MSKSSTSTTLTTFGLSLETQRFTSLDAFELDGKNALNVTYPMKSAVPTRGNSDIQSDPSKYIIQSITVAVVLGVAVVAKLYLVKLEAMQKMLYKPSINYTM